MAGIINGLAEVLAMLLRLYQYTVIIAVLLNLVNADPYNGLVAFFRAATANSSHSFAVFGWERFLKFGGETAFPRSSSACARAAARRRFC